MKEAAIVSGVYISDLDALVLRYRDLLQSVRAKYPA